MKSNRGKGCMFYGLLIGVGLPLLLVILGVLVLVGRESSAKGKILNKLDAIRAAGLPVNAQSQADYVEQRTSDSHTQPWLALFSELESPGFAKSAEGVPVLGSGDPINFQNPGGEWPEEQLTRDFLNQHRQRVNQAINLSRRQLDEKVLPVRFPIEWSQDALIPHVTSMRQAARLVYLQGTLAVYDGDSTAARRCIEGLMGCAEAVRGDAIFMSNLVGNAIDSMALDLLKSAIKADGLASQDLRALSVPLDARVQIGDHWRESLYGERAFVLDKIAEPQQQSGNSALMLIRSQATLTALNRFEAMLEIPTDDIESFLTSVAELKSNQDEENLSVLSAMENTLVSSMVPASSSLADSFASRATQFRLAVLAVELRLHEDRFGGLPANLEALEPVQSSSESAQAIQVDAQSFGYKMENGDALLWGTEFGGDPNPPNASLTSPPDRGDTRAARWLWELPGGSIEKP